MNEATMQALRLKASGNIVPVMTQRGEKLIPMSLDLTLLNRSLTQTLQPKPSI